MAGKKVKWPLGLVPACSLWAGCNYLGSSRVGQCQTDAANLRIWVCGVNSCHKIVLSLSLLGKCHGLALGSGVPPICISSTAHFQVFPTNSNRFIFCCNSAHTEFLEKPFPSLNGMAAAIPVLFHSSNAVVHDPQLKSPLLAPCAFVFFNFHSHRDFKREVGRAGFQLHSWRIGSCCVPSLTLSPTCPITHCSCRRPLLRSVLGHGSNAQAHASDTAEGPALCPSSEPRSSPPPWPLVFPASTRYPRKTASILPSEQRRTAMYVIPVPQSRHPHQTVRHRL